MSRLPFELSIPKPCTQQWSEMPGSSTTRHCASCNTQVHNLAALTPRQIERLIVKSNGHFCGRISRSDDATIIAAPDRSKPLLHASSFVLASALTGSASAQSSEPSHVVLSPVAPQSRPEPLSDPPPSTQPIQRSQTNPSPQSAPSEGESTKTTLVTGMVRDETGALIPRATVKLIRPDLSEVVGRTDESGEFAITAPRGKYTLRVEMPGFGTWFEPIEGTGRHESVAPITLRVGVVEMGEIVVVDRRPWYKKLPGKAKRLLHLSS
jgi:hypothetical protein